MTLEQTSLFSSAGSDAIPLILLGAVIVGVLLVFWLVPAVFLLSAKTAGVENRSYGKALLAIFLRIFVSLLIVLVFSLLPVIGMFFGILVAFLVNGAVIAGIFSTSYGKGLLTEILFMFFGVLISLGTAGIGLGVAVVGVSGTFHRIQQEIELGDFSWEPSRQSAEPRPEERPIPR